MGAGTEVVQLEIPARPEYLSLARMLVAAAASAAPLFPEERLDDLRLAVSEACTNAMEAQAKARAELGPDKVDDHILIRCIVADERLEVEVYDQGSGFDLEALASHPPVTDPNRLHHERGLGIPLIRILTDEVEFIPSPDGTTVRMVLNTLPSEDQQLLE